MSSIWFFSDPHIGTMRTSHTTQASRLRLRDALYEQAWKVVWHTSGELFCLGDLFDTEANDERTIQQGYQIAQHCKKVLAGNHDLPNREGKLSSLQLIAGMLEEDQVVLGAVDEPGFGMSVCQPAVVYMVPHMATQALFDQSLREVWQAEKHWDGKPNILCLHCNYNSGFIQNDASLNLTSYQADWLLERFDYVLLGHEHMPRSLHDGRLIVLGNTHPTSFSDISAKFVWEFDGQEFKQHLIWGTDGFRSIHWEYLDREDVAHGVQFADIVGSAPPDQLPKIAAHVAKLWRDNPSLLMVRNSVQSEFVAPEVNHAATRSLDLPARISTALADTDLAPVWKSYLEQAQ